MPLDPILKLSQVDAYYGAKHVLFNVSLDVFAGEVTCLLGRNGMGKTTLLNSVVALTPTKIGKKMGSIKFLGQEIANVPAYKIAHCGIAIAPEDMRVFPGLTVRENLQLAYIPPRSRGPAPKSQATVWNLSQVLQTFPILANLANKQAERLSGGEQQILTIARALMANPQLILLDEPSKGLAPVMAQLVESVISGLKASGLAIFMVEQDIHFVQKLADKIHIIEQGRICHSGLAQEVLADQALCQRYLGI